MKFPMDFDDRFGSRCNFDPVSALVAVAGGALGSLFGGGGGAAPSPTAPPPQAPPAQSPVGQKPGQRPMTPSFIGSSAIPQQQNTATKSLLGA